jgi:FG-GAP repeat protein
LPRIGNREIDLGAYEYQPPPSFVPIFVAGGAPGRVQVRRIPDGALLYDFAPYPAPYAGSVSVAVGDINGDGYPDVVTGAAVGNPHVKVFDGRAFALGTFDPNNPDASLLASFFAYGTGFNIGANVAVGDVSGNGLADIVTGATAGNPDVHVYSGRDIALHTFDPNGASLLAQWFAYGLNFNIGANVAVGDVAANGYSDVVTGATAGNPHVKVYRGKDIATGTFDPNHPDASLLTEFFVHSPDYQGSDYGTFVAVGDVNGDGYGDLITGLSHSTAVFVYDGRAVAGGTFDGNNPRTNELTFFTLVPTLAPIGATVGSADFETDGKADIVTGLTGQSASVEVVDGLASGVSPPAVDNLQFVIPDIQGGLYVSA